eukprot:COSAG01_NODE_11635_length_1892_cov_1.342443_2_plen_154_part_01
MLCLQTFDVDGDGFLNKEEYSAFLHAIGYWTKDTTAVVMSSDHEWTVLGCTVTPGVTPGGFCRLYQNYRNDSSKKASAQADFEAIHQSQVAAARARIDRHPSHQHTLRLSDRRSGWHCDVCRAINPAGRRRCTAGCDYDVCGDCWEAAIGDTDI